MPTRAWTARASWAWMTTTTMARRYLPLRPLPPRLLHKTQAQRSPCVRISLVLRQCVVMALRLLQLQSLPFCQSNGSFWDSTDEAHDHRVKGRRLKPLLCMPVYLPWGVCHYGGRSCFCIA